MAFNIMANYGTDKAAEEKGKEFQIGESTWITVARANNKRYNTMLTKLYEDSQYVLKQKNDAAEARAESITVEVMANTILVGWRGDFSIDATGEQVEYSVENAKKALKIKDFRNEVSRLAEDFGNYKLSVEKEVAKN